MSIEQKSIGAMATSGLFWAIVQNWGGRLFTFVLFIVLARFLDPTDFGTASAAALVLLLIGMIAEFGFGDAIVQRRDLEAVDVNAPFFLSLAAALVLAGAVITFSSHIEAFFEVQGLTPVLIAIVAVLPFNTISLFQEINYRRNLAFKSLALRTFLANVVAGSIAILGAVCGFGVWSLVAQTYLTTAVGLLWLWWTPLWYPSVRIRPESFWPLARFGVSAVGMRLVDFAATRLVEIFIIGRYGLALYGLYAVGSRLYQTLMLLLQSALYDVSLTILSKISHQRERMADIYINSISLSAYVASPIFVVCAALSPEICNVLFGGKWQGVDAIARPLLLLGALQCVQFLNGPYLSARGRPDRVFFAGLAKAVATVTALLFLPSDNIVQLTLIYAVGQLAATPLTFAFTLSELGIPVVKLLEVMVPAALSNTAGFLAVHFSRSSGLNGEHMHVVLAGIMLGAVFLLTYGLIAFALAREQIMRCLAFARNRIARR